MAYLTVESVQCLTLAMNKFKLAAKRRGVPHLKLIMSVIIKKRLCIYYYIGWERVVCAAPPSKSGKMEITIEALRTIVQSSVEMGLARFQKVHLPDDDRICRNEAIRHLRRNGVKYPTKILKQFEQSGKLHKHKRGIKNEKVFYSLDELQEQIFAIIVNKYF